VLDLSRAPLLSGGLRRADGVPREQLIALGLRLADDYVTGN
jgi:hypothetical protein